MKLNESDIRYLVRQILEQEDKKKKKKLELPKGLKNAFKRLDVLKLGEKLVSKNAEEVKNIESSEKEVPDDIKTPSEKAPLDTTQREILSLGNFALNILKNKKYTMIADNKVLGLPEFIGMLHGMQMTEPNTFMKFMQNKAISKVFDTYESEFPFKAKSKSKETQAATKPGEKSKKSKSKKANVQQVKDIQQIVGTDVDGSWGNKTSAKWSEWISSEEGMQGYAALVAAKGKDFKLQESRTLKRLELRNLLETTAFFPYLNEQGEENLQSDMATLDTEVDQASVDAPEKPSKPIPGNVKKFIDDNKGDAAKLAQALGYTANLAGVHQLAKDVVEKSKVSTKTKTEKFTDSEGVTYTRKDEGDGAVSYDPGDGVDPITLSSDEDVFKRLEDEYKTQQSGSEEDPPPGSTDKLLFLDEVKAKKVIWLKCVPADYDGLILNRHNSSPFIASSTDTSEEDIDKLSSPLNKFLKGNLGSNVAPKLPGVIGSKNIKGVGAPAAAIDLYFPKNMDRLYVDGSTGANFTIFGKYTKKTIDGKEYYVLGDADKQNVPDDYKKESEKESESSQTNENIKLRRILRKYKIL